MLYSSSEPPLRSTIHQIINRLGIDNLVSQIARLREDDRFRAVGPDNVVQVSPLAAQPGPTSSQQVSREAEIWFDWAFVDFWKSNYCKYAVIKVLLWIRLNNVLGQTPCNVAFPLTLNSYLLPLVSTPCL